MELKNVKDHNLEEFGILHIGEIMELMKPMHTTAQRNIQKEKPIQKRYAVF